MHMGVLLSMRRTHYILACVAAIFGPYLLPPHVVGIYIPLVTLLFDHEVWSGGPHLLFFTVFLIEWGVYSLLLYSVWRVLYNLIRRDDSSRR